MALDAVAHLQERIGRLPDLARAPDLEILHRLPPAELLGRPRQRQNRPDLVSQEQNRDRHQDQRGRHHPDHEDMRIRRIGLAAPRQDLHHCIVELDADVDMVRGADRVHPERPVDPGLDRLRQRPVEKAEKRPLVLRRQRPAGDDLHDEAELLARHVGDAHIGVGIGIGLI